MTMTIRSLKKSFPFFLFIFSILVLAAATADSWREALLAERAQKDSEFKTSLTSPMAGSDRLTLSGAGKTYIKAREGNVSAGERGGAGTVFAVFSREGKWYWDEAAAGVTCRLEERGIAQGSEALLPGALFRAGRFSLAAYPGRDSLALIVFDGERRQILDFQHLLYFAPDPDYAVKARLEKFPEAREVKITTTRMLEKTFYRYARVLFRLQGRELALTALKSSLDGPDAGTLFIPFKDMTNGKETYEVGRFLDVPEPVTDEFILDFNRCYNPLCNYSPAYNCPLPPLENFLDVAIAAGEKTYPH